MEAPFDRNFPALTQQEQRQLWESHVCVVGCGGLGGYIIEYLARVGVGRLTVVDGDRFEPSNLNRQLLCTQPLLGSLKAEAAAARIRSIHPEITVKAIADFFTQENADDLLTGCDLVMDGLDSPRSRLILETHCESLGVPIVHGAIRGWNAQVAVCPPGSGLLHRLYSGVEPPANKSSLSFTAAFCAALQCAEAIKLLCHRDAPLTGKLLIMDLLSLKADLVAL